MQSRPNGCVNCAACAVYYKESFLISLFYKLSIHGFLFLSRGSSKVMQQVALHQSPKVRTGMVMQLNTNLFSRILSKNLFPCQIPRFL